MKFAKTTLCLSLALAITACSEQVSVESHLENAKSYLSQNKINESIIELKNAIKADSSNAEARFSLGQIYLDLGHGAAAVKELERAKQYNYEINKVIPLLARAYIITGSDVDVLALSDVASKLSNEEQSRYLAYKTLAALRSEQLDLAKNSAALAQSIEGNHLFKKLASAYIRLSEAKYDDVKDLILQILEIDANQVDTLMLQAQVSMVTKDYQQAVASFKSYLSLQPRAGIVQLQLAEALLKSEQFDEAEKYADAILARYKTQTFAHYIKAMVAFNRKDYHKASEHAEFSISHDYSPFSLKLVAGASAFYVKNWQISYKHLSSSVKYLAKDHLARRMLAVTQLELGLVDEISTTVSSFEGGLGDAELVSSLSYKLIELGAIDEAKKLLEKSDDATSHAPGDNAKQALLKLLMNDPAGAEDLEEVVKLNPDFIQAEVALAYAALQNNEIKKAQTIALKWQEKYPEEALGYNLMASIAIKEKDYGKAQGLLTQSLTKEPDNIFALLAQLRVAREQNDIILSRQRADELIALKPNNDEVLVQYFAVYSNEMALEKLHKAYSANKTDIKKALIVAEAMVSIKKYEEAEALLASIAGTPNLPKRYWQLVIFNYKKQNEPSKVQPALERWLIASPYHIEPVIILAELHSSTGENQRALKVVKRGLDYHKDNITLQLLNMDILLKSQRATSARELYKKLVQSEINDSLKQGILGRILLVEKNYQEALPKLITFYNAFSTSDNALNVARAYIGNGEEPKAIKVLEKHVTIDTNAHHIKSMLADVYLKNDNKKAIVSYEDIVKHQPNNVVAHNNLAWLYLEDNKTELALKHAKEAFELAPQLASVVDTYGYALLKSGNAKAALKHASKASELTEGKNVDIQLNYIEILIANNLVSEAKNKLNSIVPETEKQIKIKENLHSKL